MSRKFSRVVPTTILGKQEHVQLYTLIFPTSVLMNPVTKFTRTLENIFNKKVKTGKSGMLNII